MKPFLHNYKIKLTAISPAHIGDGEMYDPTNYIIDEGKLHYFDDTSLIEALSEEQRKVLIKIVSQPNSYQRLQLFYRREDIRQKAKSCALFTADVAKEIEEDYKKSLGRVKQHEGNNKDVFNALSINSTIKTSLLPFIPGSSFKGALKTAFFSKEAQNKDFSEVSKEKQDHKTRNFKDYLFNQNYFGTFEQDPFSKVKVSDFLPKEPKLQIKWGVNKKKKSDTHENDNTAVRYEFIAPNSEFAAELTLQDTIDPKTLEKINSHIREFRKQLHQPQKMYIKQDIINIANSFYLPKFDEEKRWAESKKGFISPDYFQRADRYLQKAKNGKGFLIRIGRHSGAVSMTLDKHRQIFIPQMKNDKDGEPLSLKQKYVKAPFTYWLASNINSVRSAEFIGWFYCEFIDEGEYQDIAKSYEKYLHNQKMILQTAKNRLKKEENLRKEQEEIKAAEKKQKILQKKEAKRKEKEKLESLSPTEAIIYQLEKEKTNPSETKDITIFNAILSGRFDTIENGKCEALKILKEEMVKLKKWVETSKKPQKDKKYKRTIEVIKMLKEC
jgi:CRISPR-associated protein Csm5